MPLVGQCSTMAHKCPSCVNKRWMNLRWKIFGIYPSWTFEFRNQCLSPLNYGKKFSFNHWNSMTFQLNIFHLLEISHFLWSRVDSEFNWTFLMNTYPTKDYIFGSCDQKISYYSIKITKKFQLLNPDIIWNHILRFFLSLVTFIRIIVLYFFSIQFFHEWFDFMHFAITDSLSFGCLLLFCRHRIVFLLVQTRSFGEIVLLCIRSRLIFFPWFPGRYTTITHD